MSAAGFLEKLLDGAEVAWIPMGDDRVGTFTRGGGLQKKDFVESGVGCIHYGQIYTHYGTYTHTTKSFVSEEFAKKARMAMPGDLVIATTSENDDDVCKAVAWLGDGKIAVSSDACFYSHNLNPKFVSYFFQSEQFQKQKAPYITGTKVRRVNAASLAKILIPIPCPDDPEKSLAIQGEIVRILDNFTELTAKLTAELTGRKKQYNYYRDQLLTSNYSNSTNTTVGQILDMRAGKHIKATYIEDHKSEDYPYPCFGGNGLRGFVAESSHTGKYVLIGRQGALCGNVKRVEGDFYATEHAVVCSALDGIDIDWVFHILTFMDLNQYKSKSAQPGLAVGKIAELRITVPPLEEQARIGAILDKFDTLTNSITEGLPHEIELREKQYAYYRDQLLSFPKPEEMAA